MIVPRLIERKRNGGRLEPEELREIVLAYAAGDVPDYQMAALLMAVYFRGLDRGEMNALMDAMLESGKRLDLSRLPMPRIDKHSTGGVGDKVSLILAPLIASLGVAVPMMSGRGLGHTGGTLDKLESIPGFRTALTLAEAEKQVARIGCAMLGQTDEIVPADRKIYALRDATATVEVIPLIAASIMSKKIAESISGLVLDIKRGSGSFLPELEQEIQLAEAMIDLGMAHACPVVALVTAMDRPLGNACGNALEVAEAIEVLRAGGSDRDHFRSGRGDAAAGDTGVNERRGSCDDGRCHPVGDRAEKVRGDNQRSGRGRRRRRRSLASAAGAAPRGFHRLP
jgi:pyrimidine-nucleoside phosphorylase